ncbi:MAG TPA: hypothetical protein VLE44_02795 [Candidatus Saccharimonadales bacterium]|nr:hypothetical protein [Candidatus Saccharimonadales bacterium]
MVDRKRNDYLNGGATPEKKKQIKRLQEIAGTMFGNQNELDSDLENLQKGTQEGEYNPKTMTWKDHNGCDHSQRCNARRLSDEGPDIVPPDKTSY